MERLKILTLTLLLVMTACVSAHSNDIVAEGEVPIRLADSYSFTEGPAADARGNVYFTDQPNNRIYCWDCESGEITLFTDQSGRSNGMYFYAQGNLIACADMDNQLWSFNMRSTSGRLFQKGLKKPNAIKLALIAEVLPVLANLFANIRKIHEYLLPLYPTLQIIKIEYRKK